MKTVNLKLLHTFFMVAERGSFRKAADDTNRSPSAISMQIRELESQLGLSLFIRAPKEIVLTESGIGLYESVKRAMIDIQDGLDLLSEEGICRRTRIAIGCAPTLSATRLASILATFKARLPRHAVHVHEVSTALGLDLLTRGEIEFYLGPSTPTMIHCHFEPIVSDPLLACVPAEYDHGETTVSISALALHPLIMLAPTTAVRATLDALASEVGCKLRPQFEVQKATTARALASAGLGVAILPRIATLHAQALQLRLVPITEKGAQRQIGIMTLPGHVHQSVSAKLIDIIRSGLRDSLLIAGAS